MLGLHPTVFGGTRHRSVPEIRPGFPRWFTKTPPGDWKPPYW